MGCELGLGQGWMWPVPWGTVPTLLLARHLGNSEPHSAVQKAQVPSCCALPPCCLRTEAGPARPRSPSPPALGGICASAAVTLGRMWSPPHSSLEAGQMLLLDLRTLWQGQGAPGDSAGQEMGAGALSRTKPSGGLLCMSAWAPQPCSSWGSAPPCHQSRTASPCQLCVAWGHVRTLSLPLDLPSHSGCPCPHPLADPGLGPCLGTDLAAALGGPAGIIATSAYAPSLHREGLPQHCAPCQVLPQLAPGFQGGITSLIFLNKKNIICLLRQGFLSLLPARWGCGRHPHG